jgi:hypothetical protein
MPIRWVSRLIAVCCMLLPASIQAGVSQARASRSAGAGLVFYENFPANNPRHWNVQRLADGSRTSIFGGVYNIVRAKPGTMRGWPLAIRVPAAFQFNVRLRIVSGTDPYAGISFWDDLADRFVLFAITPTGTAGLFRRDAKGFTSLVYWQPEPAIHPGLGAVNTLSVNLDPVDEAKGRTLLINGTPLGARCHDRWLKALGKRPAKPAHGFHVGVVAGAFADSHSVHVAVQAASMYDGANAGAAPACPS